MKFLRLSWPQILSALEYIERDEDLSYEVKCYLQQVSSIRVDWSQLLCCVVWILQQILMLEATILLGGIGLHDRYRDMRIDIDNMSYEVRDVHAFIHCDWTSFRLGA